MEINRQASEQGTCLWPSAHPLFAPPPERHPLPPKSVSWLLGSSHWWKALPYIEPKISLSYSPRQSSFDPLDRAEQVCPSLQYSIFLSLEVTHGYPCHTVHQMTQHDGRSKVWPTTIRCFHVLLLIQVWTERGHTLNLTSSEGACTAGPTNSETKVTP